MVLNILKKHLLEAQKLRTMNILGKGKSKKRIRKYATFVSSLWHTQEIKVDIEECKYFSKRKNFEMKKTQDSRWSVLSTLNVSVGVNHKKYWERLSQIPVQLLSCVQLSVTPWTTAHQAFLYITNSQSLPKPMSIVSVIPSNHLILCHPLLLLPSIFPASGPFQMSQLFASSGQSIRVSASSSVLPVNSQDWSPLGWTGWISSQSKGLSRAFSNTTVQKYQFFSTQLSL